MAQKARFIGDLDSRKISDTKDMLIAPVMFFSAKYRGVFVIPAGFVTDWNSIPRPFWLVLPRRGKHDAAGLLHDAAYHGAVRTGTGQRVRLVRSIADDLFGEALEACGVSKFVRWAMVKAVKARAGGAYKDTPEGL
jgi:hypothetical protein